MRDPILALRPLGFPWETRDPFLFCVHHDDAYPAGTEQLGPPRAALAGRRPGQDFGGQDGWRMYHGEVVPGFPPHPHRGFETVTLVRRGFIDHADSLGATARFGQGDAQWLTAGKGVVHSEMFPLLSRDAANPLDLFQIWLNLPAADKLAPPHFAMLWSKDIPLVTPAPGVEIALVAGQLDGAKAPSPPPHSWAARADTDVAIWTITMAPGASWTLPGAPATVNRALYFFAGQAVTVGERQLERHTAIWLEPTATVRLVAGAEPVELLLLQGRPIAEPVAQHGPFVMNSPQEIQEAFAAYRRDQFGGWPWPSNEPVHPADAGRFARHADGTIERP
jgi:redox-sensitive bicupin YhaK (pirin superfamily)